jgi:hypothetical protein
MSRMCTPRALLPSNGPTIPAASNWSISRPALLNLVLVFFVTMMLSLLCVDNTLRLLNKVSLSEISTSRLMPLSSPMNSGSKYAVSYAFVNQ